MSERQTETEGQTSTSKEEMSLEEKIGMAKKFDREMKDYAKATVKEFLGIYGYEEDVDINMDESEIQKAGKNTASENTSQTEKQTETDSSSVTVPTVTSAFEIEKGTGSDRPVSSVSISSSTTNASSEESDQFDRSSKQDRNLCLSMFSWDEYLGETKGIAAPWTCFKQAATPPFNGFQCGMKLEASDPKNEGAICVATVVGVIGSRLRLRFDGCDNSSDIWRVIDSGDIHPVGWCEGNGGVLKPPVGFRMEGGSFKSFLKKTLANGELAPLRLFKKEPNTPKVNLFCPTFKLEAVDLKNPALICVGTVLNVIGDDVMIAFDGWKDTAYTYPFYSRDIFPPGWCYFSGHPLQPPGPEYAKFKASSSQKERLLLHSVQLQDDDETSSLTFVPSTKKNPHGSPAVETADSASGEPTFDHAFNIPVPVELFVNYNCEFGSYLDPSKVAELRPVYRGNVRDVLQTSIQDIVNAAYNPSIVIGFLRPGRGKIVIKAKHGQDTYTCCLQSVDHIWVFWNVIGRFTDNLRCCKNLFSSEKLQGVCSKCNDQGSKRLLEEKQLIEQEKRRNELRLEEIRNQELRTQEQRGQERRSQDLRGRELRGQERRVQELRGQELRGEEVRGQELKGQEHIGQDLRGHDPRVQEPRGQELRGHDLRGQERIGQDLRGKDLRSQDLRGEEFRGEELRGHDLRSQQRIGHDLRGQEPRSQELRNQERRHEGLRRREEERAEPSSKIRRTVNEEILGDSDVESTSSPLTWSIDEVVEYFKKSDISKYAELFRQHEIDGGALLLLNRETIMSCMQFKLGPALKLLNHISELKTKFNL